MSVKASQACKLPKNAHLMNQTPTSVVPCVQEMFIWLDHILTW